MRKLSIPIKYVMICLLGVQTTCADCVYDYKIVIPVYNTTDQPISFVLTNAILHAQQREPSLLNQPFLSNPHQQELLLIKTNQYEASCHSTAKHRHDRAFVQHLEASGFSGNICFRKKGCLYIFRESKCLDNEMKVDANFPQQQLSETYCQVWQSSLASDEEQITDSVQPGTGIEQTIEAESDPEAGYVDSDGVVSPP